MPLFHVGGIVRNLLSPILAGSGTVLAPAFDAALFMQNAGPLGVSWWVHSCPSHFSYAADLRHAMRYAMTKRMCWVGQYVHSVCNALSSA